MQDFTKHSKLTSPKIYVKNLVNNAYLLEQHPRAGKIIYTDNSIETRQLIYKKHRIIYRIRSEEIHIGAIIHTAQDLQTTLKYIKRFFS